VLALHPQRPSITALERPPPPARSTGALSPGSLSRLSNGSLTALCHRCAPSWPRRGAGRSAWTCTAGTPFTSQRLSRTALPNGSLERPSLTAPSLTALSNGSFSNGSFWHRYEPDWADVVKGEDGEPTAAVSSREPLESRSRAVREPSECGQGGGRGAGGGGNSSTLAVFHALHSLCHEPRPSVP
jgi:hypothetical protein